jgi:high-affinity nickel-transport protein
MAETVSSSGKMRLENYRSRALILCGALVAANVAAWIWALVAFAGNLELLGICAIVYGLGLRHAIDADHITAIDNVTRKMMQEEKRPVSVGFFFALERRRF